MSLKKALLDWNDNGDIRNWDDRCYVCGYVDAIRDVTNFLRDNFQHIDIIQAVARMDDWIEKVGN